MRNVMKAAEESGMTSTNNDENQRFAFFHIDLYNTDTSYEWSNKYDQPCQGMTCLNKGF